MGLYVDTQGSGARHALGTLPRGCPSKLGMYKVGGNFLAFYGCHRDIVRPGRVTEFLPWQPHTTYDQHKSKVCEWSKVKGNVGENMAMMLRMKLPISA